MGPELLRLMALTKHIAVEMRRGRFERTGRIKSFDETVPPTENEMQDALAAIEAMGTFEKEDGR